MLQESCRTIRLEELDRRRSSFLPVKLTVPFAGLSTEENTRLSESTSVAESLALMTRKSPSLTCFCIAASLITGSLLPAGASVTLTMIRASSVKPWLLATV